MTIRRRGWGLLTDLMSICLSLCLSLSLSLSVCLSHSVSLSHIFCLFVNLSLSVCGGFLPEAKHCVRPMDILKNGQRTEKCPPIHSNENCSMVHRNILERFASASWAPSHSLMHDVPDAEIFSLTSIVSIVASSARDLSVALFTDNSIS